MPTHKTQAVDNLPVSLIAANRWAVPSRTVPNTRYQVSLNDGHYRCSCAAYSICSHIRSVQRYLAEESGETPPSGHGQERRPTSADLESRLTALESQLRQINAKLQPLGLSNGREYLCIEREAGSLWNRFDEQGERQPVTAKVLKGFIRKVYKKTGE